MTETRSASSLSQGVVHQHRRDLRPAYDITVARSTRDYLCGYRALERAGGGTAAHGCHHNLNGRLGAAIIAGLRGLPFYVADDYDLVVIDHPSLGEAVADDCLLPLDQVVPAARLRQALPISRWPIIAKLFL